MEQKIMALLDAMCAFASGIAPGAIGATVALAWRKGLTWRERFTQLAVGIVVSWFVGRAIGAIWALDPFVLQGIAFTIGMIAFEATPRFIAAAADVAGTIPATLRDRFIGKGGEQ
nr:hypothetical protein [uncultured Sphingomonas sp.]